MTTELMTREEYVAKMSAGEWAEEGAIARKYRILFGLTIAEVASAIGTSPSTLGRYERGFPVSSARLLGAACFLYLDRRRMMLEPDTDNTYHKADFLIDYGEDSLLIKKREYRVVAEINTGITILTKSSQKVSARSRAGTITSSTSQMSKRGFVMRPQLSIREGATMNDDRCVVGRFGSATFTLGQAALVLGWDERTMREFLYRRKVLRKKVCH